jgi:hypothetical protein
LLGSSPFFNALPASPPPPYSLRVYQCVMLSLARSFRTFARRFTASFYLSTHLLEHCCFTLV